MLSKTPSCHQILNGKGAPWNPPQEARPGLEGGGGSSKGPPEL